jgi:putative sterol carrier protein/multimeric flavodoxin WrbA
MKVNIYYGGRGLLDDPTLYVINKMQEVLLELRVEVERYNLYECKSQIATLPQTFKEADGIILATTIEWFGIGGFMQQFLDACWLYGDKEKIATLYMQPVVMSTTYGEREGQLTLTNAWEMLGGLPCAGLCGYVEDLVAFEMHKEYTLYIEKRAENLYRTISQKTKGLPTSNQAVRQSVSRTRELNLTPQESEQLSKYISDDAYVQKQKEDIEELTGLFTELLKEQNDEEEDTGDEFITPLQENFVPQRDFQASYQFCFEDRPESLVVEVADTLECYYGEKEDADVVAKLSAQVLQDIIDGTTSFQRAFMTGAMTAKGNFRTLQMLDVVFQMR